MFEKEIGAIGWLDLTVDDAERVRDFYRNVIGWTSSAVAMGGYDDFCVHPPGVEMPVGGICHRRGPNAEIPPVWLVYFNVKSLDDGLNQCVHHGGKIICGKRDMGSGWMAIIADPAGALCALYESK